MQGAISNYSEISGQILPHPGLHLCLQRGFLGWLSFFFFAFHKEERTSLHILRTLTASKLTLLLQRFNNVMPDCPFYLTRIFFLLKLHVKRQQAVDLKIDYLHFKGKYRRGGSRCLTRAVSSSCECFLWNRITGTNCCPAEKPRLTMSWQPLIPHSFISPHRCHRLFALLFCQDFPRSLWCH